MNLNCPFCCFQRDGEAVRSGPFRPLKCLMLSQTGCIHKGSTGGMFGSSVAVRWSANPDTSLKSQLRMMLT